MSSAAIPKTMNTARLCKLEKYDTLRIPSVMQTVTGKLKMMIEMPTKAKNKDLKWMIK
jgi:hypothetical protein